MAAAAAVLILFASPVLAADGDIDVAWGDGGTVTLLPAQADGYLQGTILVRQAAGVVAASTTSSYDPATGQSDADPLLRRLDARGRGDGTFGTDGVAVVDFGSSAYVTDAIALSDDRLVLLATVGGGSYEDQQVGLVRLSPDGSLDPTFNLGQPVVTDLRTQALKPRSVLAMPDGALFVGLSHDARDGNADFAVAKYTTAGALDPSFGDGGVQMVDAGGYDQLNDLLPGPSGDLLAIGSTFSDGKQAAAVMKLTAAGVKDPRFGTAGTALLSPAGYDLYAANGVRSGRSIVIAGSGYSHTGEQVAFVSRLSAQGRVETRFGDKGVLLLDEPSTADSAAVTVATDGDLMISRGVGDGPFTARIHKIDAGSGKTQLAFGSGGSIDLGEFVVSSLLADGSGTLVAGASFDENGPSEVVQRHQ